jgi:hypothetical protein
MYFIGAATEGHVTKGRGLGVAWHKIGYPPRHALLPLFVCFWFKVV